MSNMPVPDNLGAAGTGPPDSTPSATALADPPVPENRTASTGDPPGPLNGLLGGDGLAENAGSLRAVETLAGFVDHGYLRAEGARRLGIDRRCVRTDARLVVEWIRACGAQGTPGAAQRFLRAYWYDGAWDLRDPRRTSQERFFRAIAAHEGVQLRLGHLDEISPAWQSDLRAALAALKVDPARFAEQFSIRPEVRQKGVDTRITLDLVSLAQRGAIDTAVVIAGDRDLAEALRSAQDEGVLITIATPDTRTVSHEMRAIADRLVEIPDRLLGPMLQRPDDAA
jgi:uncharacterized LabA/DUF88 family protein